MYLQCTSLATTVATKLQQRLAPHNCLEVWALADSHSLESLANAAKETALREFEAVAGEVGSSGAQASFVALPHARLLELLTDTRLVTKREEAVHEAVVHWARAQSPPPADETLLPLFSSVRYPLCSRAFFERVSTQEPLLQGALGAQVFRGVVAALAYGKGFERRAGFGASTAIFVVGGYGSDASSVERYDPTSRKWSLVAPMSSRRREAAAAVLDGKLYVVGGTALAHLLRYDPQTNEWTTLAPMGSSRCGHALVALDGKLYALGGYNGAQKQLQTAEVYDPKLDQWAAIASMGAKRYGVAAAALDGALYAAGGSDSKDQATRTVERYDPVADRWTAIASMRVEREWHGLAVLNDELYVAGGVGPDCKTMERYDAAANAWSDAASMTMSRSKFGMAALGGKLIAAGGESADSCAESYDPATEAWAPIATMNVGRTFCAVAAL